MSASIAELLQPTGLVLLGSFAPTTADGVPDPGNRQSAKELLMIGNGGSSFWAVFSNSPEYCDGGADPLDRWSRRVGAQLAVELGGLAVFPFDGPPYFPFQRWAQKTGRVAPSKISMVMHTRFGLWHAYRFALALPEPTGGLAPQPDFTSPCTDCPDRPCLQVCPVAAFNGESYAVDQCVDYLARDSQTACRTLGCEARRACPVDEGFTYLPQHARFHMDAFVRSQRP